jgi:hypothetical protein
LTDVELFNLPSLIVSPANRFEMFASFNFKSSLNFPSSLPEALQNRYVPV